MELLAFVPLAILLISIVLAEAGARRCYRECDERNEQERDAGTLVEWRCF